MTIDQSTGRGLLALILVGLLAAGCPAETGLGETSIDVEPPRRGLSKDDVVAWSTDWYEVRGYERIQVASTCAAASSIAVGGACEFVSLLGDPVGCDGLALVAAGLVDADADAPDDPASYDCWFQTADVGRCEVRAVVHCLE